MAIGIGISSLISTIPPHQHIKNFKLKMMKEVERVCPTLSMIPVCAPQEDHKENQNA